MSWNMKVGGGGGTEKAPAGNHVAVLVGIFDMGTQLDDFDPKVQKWQRRAFFVWELVGEKVAGTGKSHVIGIDLTLSLNEKSKLRKWVQARRGSPIPDGQQFDISSELGQPCLLNVIERNGYPKVDGVAAVPKGLPVPKPTYTPTAVSLEQFLAKEPIPEWCPWLYGNPLADHVAACKEVGGERPQPRKAAAPAAQAPTQDRVTSDGSSDESSEDPIPF